MRDELSLLLLKTVRDHDGNITIGRLSISYYCVGRGGVVLTFRLSDSQLGLNTVRTPATVAKTAVKTGADVVNFFILIARFLKY